MGCSAVIEPCFFLFHLIDALFGLLLKAPKSFLMLLVHVLIISFIL